MASVIQNVFGGGKPKFHPKKCELSLKLALNRMNIHKNRKIEECLRLKREISLLLAEGKEETARVKVTTVILDDYSIEVFNLMESYVQAIIARIDVIDLTRTCPEEMKEAVCSVVYTAPFLESDAKFGEPELMKVRTMFLDKYGKNFQLECSTCGCINPKLVRDLSGKIPSDSLIEFYLDALRKKEMNWENLLNHEPLSSDSFPSSSFTSFPPPSESQTPNFPSVTPDTNFASTVAPISCKILRDAEGNFWGREEGKDAPYVFISPNDRNSCEEGDKVEISLHPRNDGARSGIVLRVLEREMEERRGNLLTDDNGNSWVMSPSQDPLFILPEDLNGASHGDSVVSSCYLRGDGKVLGKIKKIEKKFESPREFESILKVDSSGNNYSEGSEGPLFISQQDLNGAEKGDTILVQPFPKIFQENPSENSPACARVTEILSKAPKEFQAKFAVDDKGNRWILNAQGGIVAFVAPGDSFTALHGDSVTCLLNPPRLDGKSTAKILTIVNRAVQPKEIVAKILVDENSNRWAQENPNSPLIFIPKNPENSSENGVGNGDKCLVRVFPPRSDGKSVGQIISLLESAKVSVEKVGILRVDDHRHAWLFPDVKDSFELESKMSRNELSTPIYVPSEELNGSGHGDLVLATLFNTLDGKTCAQIVQILKSSEVILPPPVVLPPDLEEAGKKSDQFSGSGRSWSQALVLDVGSGIVKAGISGEEKPRVFFRNVVGRPLYRSVMSSTSESREIYVGNEAMDKKGILKLSYPMERGIVNNWEDMEAIWSHTFMNELRVDPSEHAVMLTEGPLEPKVNRQRIVSTMFEKFGVPAVHVALKSDLALYAAGRETGVVLDIGDGVCHSVPVFQGYTISKGIGRLEVAGRDITDYLKILLSERGHFAADSSSSSLQIIQDIKEKLGYVSESPSSVSTETQYFLPDGSALNIGDERHRCSEPLFQPSLLGKDVAGVQHMIYKSVMSCDVDVRRELFSNLVLTGGSTLFPGFKQRLQSEVQFLAGSSNKVNVYAPDDRLYSVWSGGSVLAGLPTFNQWITRKEYEEVGPSIVNRNTHY